MSITSYKRLTFLLVVVIVALLGVLSCLSAKFQVERRQMGELWSVTRDFGRMRDTALRSEPKDAVEILGGLDSIAPRQGTSPGEMIFEQERVNAVRDIIIYLRTKTGEDLGDDPKKWIAKYEK